MTPSLLQPPSYLSPAQALELSQQAPNLLRTLPASTSSSPLKSIFLPSDSAQTWLQYENLLISCLRTGDDYSARQCLERLVARFGEDNERVMALYGLVREATAENGRELEDVLKEYDSILAENNTNVPITKRRIALLRSMGRIPDAVSALVQLLDFSPTDAEAWSELSDVYVSQGLYPQAIYALEEVLVLAPNAWNVHARLGEVQFMAATATGASDATRQKYFAEAMKRFARSVELCDDYLRGYYGLKLAVLSDYKNQVTSRLLREPPKHAKQADPDDFALPDNATIEQLNELATKKLAEIVRRYSAGDKKWQGYEEAEIRAARELLAKDSPEMRR